MKVEANETFRIKGKPVVKIFESRLPNIRDKTFLYSFQSEVLNKNEVLELINWLIEKTDKLI